MLPSISNRFNGNLCFGAASQAGTFILECTRTGGMSYDVVPNEVAAIGDIGPRSYLVSTGGTYIGKFENGFYNDTYNDISPYYAHDIQVATTGDYYILDRGNALIIKYVNDALKWTFAVSGDTSSANILLRESEGAIIYSDDTNAYTIRDNGLTAKLLYSVHVGNGGPKTYVVGSSNYMPRHVFGRAKQITHGTFMSSSSSSSSSVGLSSSSSSSSSGVG